MTELRAVVFDVGGVLINGDYRHLCRKLLADDDDVEFFLTEILGDAFHEERDRGVSMAESAAQWSARYPSYEVAILAFCDRFPEMWLGSVPGTVGVLEDLKAAGRPVFGLTNWGRETWPLAAERFPFLDLLDGVLVSSEVGLTKPDPAIFREFCTRFALAPAECLFTDDVERNVEAARGVGFRATLFTTADNFRRELVAAGLLRA